MEDMKYLEFLAFNSKEIVEKQVLRTGNVEPAAAGAEKTKLRGRDYNFHGIFL